MLVQQLHLTLFSCSRKDEVHSDVFFSRNKHNTSVVSCPAPSSCTWMESNILPCCKDLAWQPHTSLCVLQVAVPHSLGWVAPSWCQRQLPQQCLTSGCIAPTNVGCSIVCRCYPVCCSSNASKGGILKPCQWKCLTCAVLKDWVGRANLCSYLGRAGKGSEILQRGTVASTQRAGASLGWEQESFTWCGCGWGSSCNYSQKNPLSAEGGDDFTRVRFALCMGRQILSSLWVWSSGQVHPGWSILTGGFQLASQSTKSTEYMQQKFSACLCFGMWHTSFCAEPKDRGSFCAGLCCKDAALN